MQYQVNWRRHGQSVRYGPWGIQPRAHAVNETGNVESNLLGSYRDENVGKVTSHARRFNGTGLGNAISVLLTQWYCNHGLRVHKTRKKTAYTGWVIAGFPLTLTCLTDLHPCYALRRVYQCPPTAGASIKAAGSITMRMGALCLRAAYAPNYGGGDNGGDGRGHSG